MRRERDPVNSGGLSTIARCRDRTASAIDKGKDDTSMADPFDGILTPDQIRVLVTVAERGSFNKAAETIGVQQSAVTQIVARLEQKLGRRVFHRAANGVSLTVEGEAVLIYAQAMARLGRDLVHHLQSGQDEEVLSIGMTEDVGRTALPAVLGLFVRDHRQVRLNVFCALSDAVFKRYDENKLDVIVARKPPDVSRGEILWQEETAWVAGPDFVPTASEPIPLVLPPPGATRSTILTALQRSSRRWRVAFESESLSTLETAVHAGIGLSAAPASMRFLDLLHLDGDAHALPPLSPSIFVIEKRQAARSTFAEAFCEIFRTATRLSYGRGAP